MRVVFVDNLLYEDAGGMRRYVLQPHLGLISLIAVVERGGHEGLLYDPKVEIRRGRLQLDHSLYRAMAKQILALRPDAVGFTSLGCNFICTLKVAQYIKQNEPDLPILLGGPHATILDEVILERFTCFDTIVRHEAEETILPLLHALEDRSFAGLAGVSARGRLMVRRGPPAEPIADLDRLPMPAYTHHPVEELGLESLRVEAGRGCPFQCTFCSTASFFGRKYRLKSAERLVEELDRLRARYGISDFALTHDLFTVNRHKVREFCEAVRGRGYTWKCSARMDCVDQDLLTVMRDAGCVSIYYGIEAGSARMQKISAKRLDLALFDGRLEETQATGMSATVSFITGYPEEERKDQAATLDMIGRCMTRNSTPLNIQLHLLTPEPGTELLAQYRDQIRYDGHISDFNFPLLEADDGAVIEGNPEIFINHHYFPSALPRRRHILVTTAYSALYALGFVVLRHLLQGHGGRLSGLVDAMDRWAEAEGIPVECTPETIVAFFAASYGPDHYLTALVRYMYGAVELRRRASFSRPKAVSRTPNPDAYRLSERAFVLRDVPDCPTILEYLLAEREPPGHLLDERSAYLIYLPPGVDAVKNYELTAASAALLEHLASATALGAFEQETGYPVPPPAFLRALADRGWLEASEHAPS